MDCIVYSRDFGDERTVHFEGTRNECKKWIRTAAKAGRMTHFFCVTTMRKFLKG